MSILTYAISIIGGIFLSLIIFFIIFKILEKNEMQTKINEYVYPGRRKHKILNRSSEIAIASFKDLNIDKKKHNCYKIFITDNKIYVMSYHHYSPPTSPGPSPYLITLFQPIFDIIFKKQIEEITRYLDRRHLEKTVSIEKLIYRTFHFFEFNRSDVDFLMFNSKLNMRFKDRYIYGKKGKGPDDLILSYLQDNIINFYFDQRYQNEYSNLIETHLL